MTDLRGLRVALRSTLRGIKPAVMETTSTRFNPYR